MLMAGLENAEFAVFQCYLILLNARLAKNIKASRFFLYCGVLLSLFVLGVFVGVWIGVEIGVEIGRQLSLPV